MQKTTKTTKAAKKAATTAVNYGPNAINAAMAMHNAVTAAKAAYNKANATRVITGAFMALLNKPATATANTAVQAPVQPANSIYSFRALNTPGMAAAFALNLAQAFAGLTKAGLKHSVCTLYDYMRDVQKWQALPGSIKFRAYLQANKLATFTPVQRGTRTSYVAQPAQNLPNIQ